MNFHSEQNKFWFLLFCFVSQIQKEDRRHCPVPPPSLELEPGDFGICTLMASPFLTL